MSEDFCSPYPQCPDIDGRLLINRTLHGPALAREEAELPFGALTLRGAEVRPSLDISFLQQWRVKEACYAPVRSVMGLAPGETVTIDVARREEVDFATLFQQAVDSTTVDSQTSREGTERVQFDPSTSDSGPAVGLIPWLIDAIGIGPFGQMATGVVGATSSLLPGGLPGGGSGVPAVPGMPGLPGTGPTQYADLLSKIIQVLFGGGSGGSPVVQDTLTTVEETLHTIEMTNSRHLLTETSTRVNRSTEQRMTRTFANPYRDRSLELRFIPVFRRFEVVTILLKVQPGISMIAGPVQFPPTGIVQRYGQFLERAVTDPRLLSAASAELGAEASRSTAVHDHLEANAELYTKRFLAENHREGNFGTLATPLLAMIARHTPRTRAATGVAAVRDPDATAYVPPGAGAPGPGAAGLPEAVRFAYGFDWSKAHVQDGAVKVPLAPLETLRYYWPLSASQGDNLSKAIATVAPGALAAVQPQPHVREVMLFMGTHIEAVAGECVLPGLPPV